MNKLFAVLKREYFQAVRKKMFIIMTFLMPVLMIGLFLVPSLMMERGLGAKKVVVLDATGQLRESFVAPEKEKTESEKNDVSKKTDRAGRSPSEIPDRLRRCRGSGPGDGGQTVSRPADQRRGRAASRWRVPDSGRMRSHRRRRS